MRCGSFLIVVLIRQPAQGAARVPGRRRHGWHVRCMSFTGFWLYRSAGHLNSLITGFTYMRELAISPPPDVCHPSASSDGTLVKNRGDPERARLIERPSLPRAAPRLPRLPPPSSTLPTAVRAGLRNLHTAFNMGKGKGAPENPALAHAPDSSRGLSLLALTLRRSSPGQARASRSSRSPTTLARRSKQPTPYPPSCGAHHLPST